MNNVDAWNAFIDQVAQPVRYYEGRTYKTIFDGRVVLVRLTKIVSPILCEAYILGHGPIKGKLSQLHGLYDNVKLPPKLLK